MIFYHHFLAPDDYTSISGSLLTFSVTNTRFDVSIPVNNDNINEGIEEFLAILTFQSVVGENIQLVPDQATVQINDNDGKVILLFCF